MAFDLDSIFDFVEALFDIDVVDAEISGAGEPKFGSYGGGVYEPDDLIIAANGDGFLTPSEFIAGENGIQPDA